MAEQFKDIRVSFTGDDTKLRQVTSRVGKDVGTVGNKVKTMGVGAQLGFRSITNAAERMAAGIGIPTVAMTDLSSAFESQASKGIPRWVFALGGSVLAVGALVMVIKSVIDQRTKLREQLEKSVKQLGNETKALFANTAETDRQRQAKFRLLEVTRRQYLLETPKLIRMQEEEVDKAEKRLDELVLSGGGLIAKNAQQMNDYIEGQRLTVEKSRATLEELRADYERARTADVTFASFEERNKKELASQKAHGDAMVAEFRRVHAEEVRIEDLRFQAKLQTAQNFAIAFRLVADLGGKYGRKAFSAYKLASAAETVISTSNAFMAALSPTKGLGPVAGWGLALAIAAKGAATLAVINKQKYGGGGGGLSAGSIGTFPANPATGIPETAAAPNLTLIINGRTMEIGQITEGVVQTLYNANGTVGGLTVQVERSA